MRGKIFWIAVVTCLIFFDSAQAQKDNPGYAVAKIPVELFKESHTVVREDHLTLEIKALNNSVVKSKVVKTILNRKGDRNASFHVFYDKDKTVKSFSGALYDKNGILIRKLKKSDIRDYSAVSSFSIYEDSRVKTAELLYSDYPFTVEFEYEAEIKGTYHFPSWGGVSSISESVIHSSYKITAPSGYDVRYREYNYPGVAAVSERDGMKEYFWEIKNYKAIDYEPFMVDYIEIIPWVQVAPSEFMLNGYRGNGTSWESLGKFFWELNKGRDALPPGLIAELKTLTADAETDREKIKRIYHYLQKTTRYVSIQLGIGGFQPFEASYVKANGYGDCKALSNYMYAMLKAVDIPSVYTLVRAGENEPDIRPDFPADRFNHVILCVPNNGDTVWLECTSQTVPFGYLSTFTMNRHVLFITEKGGVIGRTPAFGHDRNLQLRMAKVQLSEAGTAVSVVNTSYEGYQYENISDALEKGEEEQKKFLYESISIPSFEISSFAFSHQKEAHPRAFEELHIEMRRYATMSGTRMFFQPNLMNQATKLDKPLKERKYKMEITFPYTDIDTIEYEIPKGYQLEFLPERVELKSEFGSYSAEVAETPGRISYIRKRISRRGIYDAEKYMEFVEYVNKIAEADRMKLVLVKKS